MKLAILSRAPAAYSTRRLEEAARSRGHEVKILDTLKFSIEIDRASPELWYGSSRLGHYDAVIPRIGASITHYGTAVVRQFEQLDVYTPSSSHGISNSRDKLRALQILSRHDIGLPHTAFVRRKQDILRALERVGGAPVIIKLLEGTQGVGVILADSVKVAETIVETLQSGGRNVLIQKFVGESSGKDIRAFVVGDRVVAAMRRVAQGGDFRSNVHRGGKAEPLDLDPVYADTAIRAAQILGLKVAGVDMLEGRDGPQVMEVNSSPGLEGIETATQLDVAGAVIDFVSRQVSFPELDVRQRLSVSASYGVTELHLGEQSDLVGKTIGDSGLRARDIVVLTLHRGHTVIPNPRESRVLEVDDRLLCFGKLEAMRDLVPARRRRKRAPVRPLETEIDMGDGA